MFRVQAIGVSHVQRAGPVSMMGAPWAMKLVAFLRKSNRQRHAGPKSNLRLRVRFRNVELGGSEIASLGSIACCSLLSAISRNDMGGARAEAAVLATMWPPNRRALNHTEAPRLCPIDRRHFLREMMTERCA
ncbi:[NiFe]-hydrogenase assembly chaperone HybE [Bradyrhizobium elkanii]|uniref:[NiFe]-hydrogenase assembly chaperone HybE n=2 Tax=Bradyrhizobium elkanii TaxID=29448 RepID=UPI0012F6D166|nr:[NiFe]-hydrogenase assembly chaperone HybE [Bradyrhizobium elkanii]UQD80139.1 [NiFe]-hydrogenase assembly chaperone HybE [Bradyrhizobium elkanii USDA 76]